MYSISVRGTSVPIRPVRGPSAKARLAEVLHSISTDCTGVRDAFDFDSGSLVARIDARRGESEFFLPIHLVKGLENAGFRRSIGVDISLGHSADLAPLRDDVVYATSSHAFSMSTEISDKGRHHYHVIVLSELDPSYSGLLVNKEPK